MKLFSRKRKNQFVPDEKLAGLNTVQFSFRDGFSDRLSARLENMLEVYPSIDIIRGLSSVLPRLLMISSIIILLFTIAIFLLNGEINMEAFIGSHGVDENNFIGYLILE